ncbi:BAG family molecular chaperone regulator 1-like [Dioscorea cayenensis subsp. rotundata]|uniref:BAG family molecular chaperone regulator 1-like n=1 Tax=Dioscorea cayennensis subsp. rotundata TaxID=55577 RepID=A0AB40C6N4_DIOCR|nr:BAG family molecular chaperone regulator 1-like [Dioscorea cayenensis subsp. rotundata]
MLRSKSSKPSSPAIAGDTATAVDEWEVRPGGMLVQKRNPNADAGAAAFPPIPNIRVRVKHGSAYLDVYLSPQSTFGELKKLLSERTGLHPLDQKLVYKGKDRDSSAYLDIAGVKDRSKIVLLEDSTAQAKRFLEMRRSAKMEKAAKSISQISVEVDKLALQVSALDVAVSKGVKVGENDVLNLIELLMAQLIKLDGIAADGETKQQRGMQVRRVQKYVERLDVLKIKSNAEQQKKKQQQQQLQIQQQQATTLDFFDSLFSPPTPTASTVTTVSSASSAPTPRFDWEIF